VSAPAEETGTSPRPEHGARRATVLLVDGNAGNQEIYRSILAHHGFTVLLAADGEAGVRMARSHAPGLILMKLAMPIVAGLQAMRILKADPATCMIPIVVLTAHAMRDDEVAAQEAGYDSLLLEPVEPHHVAAEARRLLSLPEPLPG